MTRWDDHPSAAAAAAPAGAEPGSTPLLRREALEHRARPALAGGERRPERVSAWERWALAPLVGTPLLALAVLSSVSLEEKAYGAALVAAGAGRVVGYFPGERRVVPRVGDRVRFHPDDAGGEAIDLQVVWAPGMSPTAPELNPATRRQLVGGAAGSEAEFVIAGPQALDRPAARSGLRESRRGRLSLVVARPRLLQLLFRRQRPTTSASSRE